MDKEFANSKFTTLKLKVRAPHSKNAALQKNMAGAIMPDAFKPALAKIEVSPLHSNLAVEMQ
ncbi:hypothetical protein [Methylicorpusculum sp.]|uniref:hypothetical protein n=1 Tax=Methylicorpusculum sp. TaxID=2713644 RepID=UPI002ABC6330|nr:hypothetical protein [Methylicorpusculum sp.]MDZ4152071.1 hypothetical protein [Methylicorpusculum sp.]